MTNPNLQCPRCKAEAVLIDTAELYGGRSYGMAYQCPNHPDIYVGCHGDSDRPKGTLADEETRELRKQCHRRFDALWRGKAKVRRQQCYAALAEVLGSTEDEAHIGVMDAEGCRRVLACMPAIEARLVSAGPAIDAR